MYCIYTKIFNLQPFLRSVWNLQIILESHTCGFMVRRGETLGTKKWDNHFNWTSFHHNNFISVSCKGTDTFVCVYLWVMVSSLCEQTCMLPAKLRQKQNPQNTALEALNIINHNLESQPAQTAPRAYFINNLMISATGDVLKASKHCWHQEIQFIF